MNEDSSKNWMASIWVRLIVFLWMFVFPFVFVALPLIEMFGADGAKSTMPLWALIVWMLAPAAVATGLKYFRGSAESNEERDDAQLGR